MAIYTPRGLKIRLPINYAFTLMGRLYPKVDAFQVLKTTEGIESIPEMLGIISAIVTFNLGYDPLHIFLYVALSTVIGKVLTTLGLFIVPGLVQLGKYYSYASGFGFFLFGTLILGFITVGWKGVVSFLIGKMVAGIFSLIIEFGSTKRVHNATGEGFTTSEINFISAYRIHAQQIGKTTDVSVSDEELASNKWKPCFEDLLLKWPEVVKRFTQD